MKILQVTRVQSTTVLRYWERIWGLFSVHVVQQTRLDLNIDSEWRFHNGFNSHYIYQVYTCIMYDVNQLLFMMTLFRDLVEKY